MRTLNQLTQSHLSVLVLDKDSHNPIVRMPIYAELSIVEEAPPWKISGDDLGAIAENSDFFGSETVGAILRSSLAQYIEENTFRGLDEEKKQSFLGRVINIILSSHAKEIWYLEPTPFKTSKTALLRLL